MVTAIFDLKCLTIILVLPIVCSWLHPFISDQIITLSKWMLSFFIV